MAPAEPALLFTDPDTGELKRRRWRLDVIDGTDGGKGCDLDRSPSLVGAAPASVLVLTDDTVSRYHLEIDTFAEGLRLRDLDSTNGTFVGNTRIRDAFVENGDTFRLGRTLIRVTGEDEPASRDIATDPEGAARGSVESFGSALAADAKMRGLFDVVRRVANSRSSVLIQGEPGSGKATCARLIHDLGPRKRQPFVTVTLTPGMELEDAERLFLGHIEVIDPPIETYRAGSFEQASGGTLVIEQVEHLPPELQPRILRAIESGEITRIGEQKRRRIDVRVIATTRLSLRDTDHLDPTLLRRLGVVHLAVPPLRERSLDVMPLVRSFLARQGVALDIGPGTEALLRGMTWPGNVDQLEQAVRELSRAGSLADCVRSAVPPEEDLQASLRCAMITDQLTHRRGDVSAVAETLSVPTPALFRYLSIANVDLDAM